MRQLRQREPRVLGRDADVAGERHLEPAAEAEAMDRGDDRLAHPLERGDPVVVHALAAILAERCDGRELLDVGAGAKPALAGAAQQDGAHRRVTLRLAQPGRQLLAHRAVDRVHRVGAVERQHRDLAARFGAHGAHARASDARSTSLAISMRWISDAPSPTR